MKTLIRLQHYMGSRRPLLPCALFLSALSALLGVLPFLYIWEIIRILLQGEIHSSKTLIPLALQASASAVGAIVLYFLALMCSHLAAFRVETRIRGVAMRQIIALPLGFFDTTTTGKIRKIIDTNASITHSFLAHQLPDLAGTFLVPVITLILLFVFDWRLGIASLLPLLMAMALMGHMMGTQGKKFMSNYMNALEEMNTEAVEYVRGIPVVKVFQQTVFSFKNFHSSIQRYKEMVSAYTNIWEKPMSLYLILIHGIVFFLVPAAILLLTIGNNIPEVMQNLFLYVLITPVFAQCIMKSSYLGQALGQAAEATNRLENILDYPSLSHSASACAIDKTDIEFENVSFAYPGASRNALNNVRFTVPCGTVTALVGASGSGKTTIARLIPRFWDADSGRVRIGGTDVKEIQYKDLMKKVSFVFQNTRLFKTTLRENLLYGNPDVSEEELARVIDAAQCREIVDKMPDGLDTRIGTEGVYLSGGEQQRIVLARAMLKNAPVVILDEATAFADPENEHLIQEALSRLIRGKTVLMIAHRLTSVQAADQILVMNGGSIIEQGTHQDLRRQNGVYEKMWNEYQSSVKWTLKEGEI